MTPPIAPLHEPLRLLRETSLAAGFEERLAERLEAVHREWLVMPRRFSGHRRTILLLAAIALPAAAFASGGWLLEHRQQTGATSTDSPREVDPLPKLTSKAFSIPAPVAPPQMPKIEELSPSREQSDTTSGRSTPTNAALEPRVVGGSVRDGTSTSSAPAANAPARIESLDLSIPRGEGTKTSTGPSAEKLPADSLELRKASEHGATRTGVGRENSSSQRGSVGEHRGSDAAQQARERVQARERKGQ